MTFLRILGVLLTMGACTALGMYWANLGAFRLQDLLEFKKALLILKSEIEYAATPLPEAMSNIALRVSNPVSKLFSNFADGLANNEGETAYRIWLAAIEAEKRGSFLVENDWEIISAFGKTLGYLDKQMQLDTIRFTVDYVEQQLEQLQTENAKNQRMYRSLGVIGGVLLLVLFW